MLKSWRLKRAWMRPFTCFPMGEDLYEWLTAVVLGTQRGMSRKWCYWFREHLVLSRRYARIGIAGLRLWLFEPGWSVAPVILGYLATGRGPLVTEGRRRLAGRYVANAVEEVAGVAPQVCRSAGRSEPGLVFLESLSGAPSPEQVLDACQARYQVCSGSDLATVASESADLCMSMGRLEHYPEDGLARLLAQMRRVLVPGGVGSHIVDHHDHYWHFDKSIHCFHHLTYSDEEWARVARGRKGFRNRLLESDYLRLFEASGFEVLGCVHERHRDDATAVDPRTLWGRYRELSREDLAAAVSHFVVRRL